MSELCKWLHSQLEILPLIRFPFDTEQLPLNGIYFFYEQGETWGHSGDKQRVVRVGTHRDGNFRNRIKEHFLMNRSSFEIYANKPKYSDRSIFRKNIGRALLTRDCDKYIDTWNIDFTKRENRQLFGNSRDAKKEEMIEKEITKILKDSFQFRFIIINVETERMGSQGLESSLIGTLSQCRICRPSVTWLGNFSPVREIRESGLWLKQHVRATQITEKEKSIILEAINKTRALYNPDVTAH